MEQAEESMVARTIRAQVDAEAKKICETEWELLKQEAELRSQYPDIMAKLDAIKDGMADIGSRKEAIKKRLIAAGDYDTHVVLGLRFGVSKVVKMTVADIEKVPEEFKVYRAVADEKKAADHYKLTGEVPEGFTDKSYNKLNWRAE